MKIIILFISLILSFGTFGSCDFSYNQEGSMLEMTCPEYSKSLDPAKINQESAEVQESYRQWLVKKEAMKKQLRLQKDQFNCR